MLTLAFKGTPQETYVQQARYAAGGSEANVETPYRADASPSTHAFDGCLDGASGRSYRELPRCDVPPDGGTSNASSHRERLPRTPKQTVLRGRVIDEASGVPLPGANVFLSGTSRGSSTDSTGRYVIRGVSPGAYTLVASMVGYETVSVQIEIERGQPQYRHDFTLQQVAYELDEVRVDAERPAHWKERFETFRAHFLGRSDFAEQTRIVNPYVLSFESENRRGHERLTASAQRALEIENRALGYHITYVLRRFRWDEEEKRLQYDGYTYFEELEPASEEEQQRWQQNREETLRGSLQHFLWALTHGRLSEEGFELRRGYPPLGERPSAFIGEPVDARDILRSTGSPHIYRFHFDGYLRLTYEQFEGGGLFSPRQEEVTWLTMSRPTGRVHDDGYFYPPMPVTLHGDLGLRRVAQRLPNGYVAERRGETKEDREPSAVAPWRRASSPTSAYELVYGPWEAGAAELESAAQAMNDSRWSEAWDELGAVLDRTPDNLTARYLRGITARHLVQGSALHNMDHWDRGVADLEYVLARDSTFRDALTQYALYGGAPFPQAVMRQHESVPLREAIRLARRQLQIDPTLQQPHLALLRLYDRLIRQTGTEEALNWLRRPQADAYDRYFAAEVLRRDGQLQEADRLLERLLGGPLAMPRQPLLATRARIAAEQDRPAAVQRFVHEAIASIRTPLEAALVFEDVKYIVSPEELDAYRSIREPEEYATFFEALWAKRHPLPGSPVNPRIASHYERLVVAEEEHVYRGPRDWNRAPVLDEAGSLELPSTYGLNRTFNDKGLIYIRHGPPDDRAFATGATVPPNESWRYDNPPMDFHFFKVGAQSNWRLASGLGYVDAHIRFLQERTEAARGGDDRQVPHYFQSIDPIVASRARWGGLYAQLEMVQGDSQYVAELREELAETAQAWAEQGVTTDRYRWPSDQQTMSVPYLVSSFRGASGRTDMVVHYALPIGRITDELAVKQDSTGMEVGAALYDSTWGVAAEKTRQGFIPTSTDRTAAAVDRLRFSVAPGTYHLGLSARVPATDQVAAYRETYQVSDFSGEDLAISDLVPAFGVTPARTESRYNRRGHTIEANPIGVFSRNRPLFVYFEIYNLTFGAADKTRYTIEYLLVPIEDDDSLLERVFGGGDDRVALSVEHAVEGSTTAPSEYIELDASDVAPGRYEVVVEVTDEHTGQTARETRSVELIERAE